MLPYKDKLLIPPWKRALPFVLSKLNPIHLIILFCMVWNWPSVSSEGRKCNIYSYFLSMYKEYQNEKVIMEDDKMVIEGHLTRDHKYIRINKVQLVALQF